MLHFLNNPFFRLLVLLCYGNISRAAELLHMAHGQQILAHTSQLLVAMRHLRHEHKVQEAALGPVAQGNLGTVAMHWCTSTLH